MPSVFRLKTTLLGAVAAAVLASSALAQVSTPAPSPAKHFPQIKLYTVDGDLGGWQKVQAQHFADGGIFDSIVARK